MDEDLVEIVKNTSQLFSSLDGLAEYSIQADDVLHYADWYVNEGIPHEIIEQRGVESRSALQTQTVNYMFDVYNDDEHSKKEAVLAGFIYARGGEELAEKYLQKSINPFLDEEYLQGAD